MLASLEPDGGADKGEDSDVAEDDGDDEVGGMVSLLCPKLTKENVYRANFFNKQFYLSRLKRTMKVSMGRDVISHCRH